MKPCPHCGKELPQEMQFCPYCMEKLITETVIGDTPIRRRRRWLWLVVLLLLLLLLLCGLWLMWKWRHPPTPKKEDAAILGGNSATTTTTTVISTAPSTIVPATTISTRHATNNTATTTMATQSAASATHTTSPSVSTSINTSTSTRSSNALCAAGHNWENITQTVHVDEVGHYEKKTVEKRLTLFRCALCYKEFGTLEDYYDHFDSQHDGDSLEIVFRDRYETFAEYREVEEQTWVVDTPAYDKTITVGRRCRVCGKTETNEHKE